MEARVSWAPTDAFAAADGAAAWPAPAPRRARLLIVDDEPMIGRLVGKLLQATHGVESVTSGDEALALVRGGARYDLILCDLMMPGMTGKDLYEELQRTYPDAARRLVFLSGGVYQSWAMEFLRDVQNPQIHKPFAPATFLGLIGDLLDAVGGVGPM